MTGLGRLEPPDRRHANGGNRRILVIQTRSRLVGSERETAGNPRPSVEERYRNRENYVVEVKAAAEAPLAERLLLATDAAAYVAAAKERDWF
jgi:hypothetical protein